MESRQPSESDSAHHRVIAELACDYSIVGSVDREGRVICESVWGCFDSLLGYADVDPFGELFGRGSLRSRKARSFIHPEDFGPLAQRMRLFLEGPWRDSQEEFRVITKSGDVRWLRQTLRRGRISETGSTHLYAAVQDITVDRLVQRERRALIASLEQQLEERTGELEVASRRLQRVHGTLDHVRRLGAGQDLAGRVAHAIRNPLAVLIGSVERELGARDGECENLERILQLAGRIEGLVQRTLGLFAGDELELDPVAPEALLGEAAAAVADRASAGRVTVSLDTGARLEPIAADASLLTVAVVSIVENAVESAAPGGNVWLEARSSVGGKGCEFRIADDGSGVAPELRERIFEPFFTRRPSGAGLGLALARGVVEAHGGRVRVGDRPGGGAAFVVEIPR